MADVPEEISNDAESGTPRPSGLQRYRLLIAYDGSEFHGWQKQEPPDGPVLRTVQGVMHDAMLRLFKQPINLVGASRTDSRVHARGQVAHFDAVSRVPVERMAMAINSRLPDDIEVREAEAVPFAFDAIRCAVTKQYTYRIHNTGRRPLGLRHMVHHYRHQLDADLMDEAAARLLGEHDFEGFSAAGHGRESTVRTIHRCEVKRDGDQVTITVEGSGFLWNMVRIIAGTLVEVGRGRFEAEHIDEILRTADRQLAGPTLPPQGLCLEWIKHEWNDDVAETPTPNP
jgi:tRNA pseudouridine38-40 synthase